MADETIPAALAPQDLSLPPVAAPPAGRPYGTVPPPATPALSQVERLVDVFIAPSKTFNDIRRSASWWLPFLILTVIAYAWVAAIQTKVGWPQVVENTLRQGSQAQQDRIAASDPAQQVQTKKMMQTSFQVSFYATPVANFIFFSLTALGLWLTVNFAAGGRATFWKVFAMLTYAWLPQLFRPLLSTITLFAGANPEDFNLKSPIGSNLGYYLSADSPAWLRTLGSSLDIFVIWSMVLMAIGLAIVAERKRSTGYIVIFGWWAIIVLGSVAVAAVTG